MPCGTFMVAVRVFEGFCLGLITVAEFLGGESSPPKEVFVPIFFPFGLHLAELLITLSVILVGVQLIVATEEI